MSRFILNLRMIDDESHLVMSSTLGLSTSSTDDPGRDPRILTLAFDNIGAPLEFNGDVEYDLDEYEERNMYSLETTGEQYTASRRTVSILQAYISP